MKSHLPDSSASGALSGSSLLGTLTFRASLTVRFERGVKIRITRLNVLVTTRLQLINTRRRGGATIDCEVTDIPIPAAAPQPDLQPSTVQSSDRCPSCGVPLAADQRYCLECGQRCGEPRLPFMDAAVLMDAVRRSRQPTPPPQPRERRSRISPNAALIAGVGTLLLALGVGVLIGHSGPREVAQTAAAPQIIKVGGGGEEASEGAKDEATTGGGAANAKTKEQKEAALKKAEAHPASEEILKPAGDVKLPPSTVKPGDACEKGAEGCQNGKFTGDFFE